MFNVVTVQRGRRTLCGDHACLNALAVAPCESSALPRKPSACRIALAVAPCKFSTLPVNLLRGSCVSNCTRCGAVRIFNMVSEPSAGIVRVETLSLWPRANFQRRRRTLCGDRPCRIALAVAPCEFLTSPVNLLRDSLSCLSNVF